MVWTDLIAGAIGGVFGALLYTYIKKRSSHPYVWTCTQQGCQFFVSGNAKSDLVWVIQSHKHYHKEIENHYG